MTDHESQADRQINPPEEVGYCIEISDSLHAKISRHVEILKNLDYRGYSKRRWAMEAVKEKLEALSCGETNKPHVLSFAFPKQVNKKIEEKIALIKQVRKSYSKKKWILEAIYEKLDRDQQKITKLLTESNPFSVPETESKTEINLLNRVTKKYVCSAQASADKT